ncbi:MAG: hypothetical protein NDJ92_01975 [Thermoanaerobaculia bacterium]|nr:hypothetical protein [Thermoanaerobaculia bacterium]
MTRGIFASVLAGTVGLLSFGATSAFRSALSTPSVAPIAESGTLTSNLELLAVIVLDQSLSAPKNRTEVFTAQHLDSLIARVECSGGELAIAAVDDVGTNPLLRLRLAPPPQPPTEGPRPGNLLEAAAARSTFEALEETHFAAQRAWLRATRPQIQAFRVSAATLLAAPRHARHSDYGRAFWRVRTFLAEPRPAGARETVVLVVGDGRDTVTRRLAPLPGNPAVVIVNGIGSRGVLASFEPVEFEAIEPALHYINEFRRTP